MKSLLPPARPRITSANVECTLRPYNLDRALHPIIVVGERGYYRDTMGAAGRNDRGLYDDAISLVTPNGTNTYNASTDPTELDRTGLASLAPGLYHAHRFDKHRGQYLALCQRAGEVIVKRDGTEHFRPGHHHGMEQYGECLGGGHWKGMFGINIHRGGNGTTSSLGCQTIPPGQWEAFIAQAESEARRIFGSRWRQAIIPYLLVDRTA